MKVCLRSSYAVQNSLHYDEFFSKLFSVLGRFMKINTELPLANKRVFSTPIQYSAVKQLATDYQKAKAQVTTALMTAGCGHWIEKPVEQDQFSL